jgi:FKBP-type peptidyl-prolyl cis-trans isomerase
MRTRILTIGLAFLLLSCLQEDSSIPATERLEKEIKQIDEYLAANPGDPDDIIVKDASGVRIVITELGSGPFPPNSGNNLKAAYTGRLFSNGAIFDSNDAFYFKTSDNIINGWKIGLTMMTQGTRAKLYIPSGYAYGDKANGPIPANSILVFDMFLESVASTDQQIARFEADVLEIDIELEGNENVVAHETGIRYEVTQIGVGITPNLYDQVKINYKGKLFLDGSVFQDVIEVAPSASFSSRVINYTHGVITGLQLLQEGGKVTLYVPSGLAFGPAGLRNTAGELIVPANENVIFEIELLDVIE